MVMSDGIRRRLTTIIAADVAGYSRLVREDEEATLRALRAHRHELFNPLIEQYGGRVANTAGDSLLLEFPSAVEAVRCAVAIQNGLAERNTGVPVERQIRLRIGINVGDVVAEGNDLLGDGVNIAARLEALADTGGIYLSRSVRDQVRDHLDLDLADLGEVKVKNIDRPVRVFKVLGTRMSIAGETRNSSRQSRITAVVVTLFLFTIVGVSSWWWIQKTDFEPADQNRFAYQLPQKPSIAVLPFHNLSGDPGQDFLAAGLGEDILTSLSKLSGLFVISGSITSKSRDEEYTAKRIAEDFGVRYVLKGSMQRDGSKIRVSAQLVDAIDGRFVWSDRYDKELTGLFSVKDEITLKIVANIGAQLELGERDKIRSRETNSLDAWLLQREGFLSIQKLNAEDNAIGRKLLEQAIRIDPTFATAYANLGTSYRFDYQMGWVEDRQSASKKAFEYFTKALSIDPTNGAATASLAAWHLVNGDVKTALNLVGKAVHLEPNNYFVRGFYGMALLHSGDADRAVEELKLSLRLSPRGPDWVVFKLAEAYLIEGNASSAAKVAKGLLDRPPSSPSNKNIAHINHALALSALGQTEAARNEVALAVEAFPKRTLTMWTKQRPYAEKELQEAWSSTLRELGMP